MLMVLAVLQLALCHFAPHYVPKAAEHGHHHVNDCDTPAVQPAVGAELPEPASVRLPAQQIDPAHHRPTALRREIIRPAGASLLAVVCVSRV